MQVRRTVTTLLVGTILMVIPETRLLASSQAPPTPEIIGNGSSIEGRAQRNFDDDTPERHARPSSRPDQTVLPPSTPHRQVYRVQLRWQPETQSSCLTIQQVPGSPADLLGSGADEELTAISMASITPLCPGSAPAPAVPSPGAAAQMVWRDQVKLPPPEPYIAPGKAITGLAAFLEIRGSPTRTQSFNVFGYSLTITATASSYDVDWGDGSWSRGLTSAGGPWPHGDVRHVYTRQGTYTVRVMEHWTGTWSVAGGGGGTVDGTLASEGRIDSFPVIQVQAVRNR